MSNIYFIPYILLVTALAFLYLCEIRKIKNITTKGAVWSAYILTWIFIGLRGHILTDFVVYYQYYHEYPDLFHLSSSDLLNLFEPGYNIFTSFTKIFISNYFAWIAFNTLIDLIIIYWFFNKYCKSVILPLIFFIIFNGLLLEFNLYRNIKGIECFLLSLSFLQKRKFIPYLCLNLLGTSFHSSSILYIPLYFFIYKRIPWMVIWAGVIISNAVFIFNIKIISSIIENISLFSILNGSDKISAYVEPGINFKFSIGFFERTFSFVLFTYLYSKLVILKKSNIIFYNSFWLYYCSFLLLYETSVLVDRIPTLFTYSYWVLYSYAFIVRDKSAKITRILIEILVIAKVMASYTTEVGKYENILFINDNYEERAKIARSINQIK